MGAIQSFISNLSIFLTQNTSQITTYLDNVNKSLSTVFLKIDKTKVYYNVPEDENGYYYGINGILMNDTYDKSYYSLYNIYNFLPELSSKVLLPSTKIKSILINHLQANKDTFTVNGRTYNIKSSADTFQGFYNVQTDSNGTRIQTGTIAEQYNITNSSFDNPVELKNIFLCYDRIISKESPSGTTSRGIKDLMTYIVLEIA